MITKNKILFLSIIFIAFFLRFFMLSSFPPGLYSDEASLGYNAYSLLKTGKDEYGKLWPLTFRSFGDYKPPLSSWTMIPFIAIFGLSEFSVRLPFAIAGVLSVILIYYLCLELFPKSKNKQTIALLSALFLAISPWHLNQTRSAMLVGLEVFFNALGVFLFLKGLKKRNFLILSAVSFSLAVYAYYGSRITAPLTILALVVIYRKKFFNNLNNIWYFLLGFVVLLPLFIAIAKDPLTILGRAKYMSIFLDKNVQGQLWEASTLDGPNFSSALTRFFHNKPFYYFKDITRRWLHHFEPSFLFAKGGSVAPFQIPNMGLFYLLDFIFLIAGIFYLIKEKSKGSLFIIFWFLLAPFVSALTFITPASNRNFNMIFPACMIITFGITVFISKMKNKKNWIALIFLAYLALFIFYLYQYYYTVPHKIPDQRHFGRKQSVQEIVQLQDNYDKVILTDKGGPPYIFLLFYQQYDPRKYWESMKIDPFINDLGWGHISGFANYEISREFYWDETEKNENILYVSYEEEVPDIWQETVGNRQMKVNIIKKILYPNGQTAYKIFDLTEK